MDLYILKYNMLYYIAKCPANIIIPINDFQAIKLYPEYTHLYNIIIFQLLHMQFFSQHFQF